MTPPPSLLDMMGELVAARSASSFEPEKDQGNRAPIDLLVGWLAAMGFDITLLELEGRAPRANLVARLGDGPGGLALAGHVDTVGCEQDRWKHDPYALTEDGGRYYGLGIADMKSFFAVSIEAIRRRIGAVPDGSRLHEPLYLVATADEECAMQGAHALVEAGVPRARYAIVGEPTALVPLRMHKGMMMTRVALTGRSGHSSVPHTGASALEAMIAVCNSMVAWRADLQAAHRDDDFEVPVPTLNIGTMHGGDHPNRICGHCEMHMDLRPLPGMDLGELRVTMRERIEAAIQGSGVTLEMGSLYPGTPPMLTRPDSPLVRAAEELTGKRAGSAGYGTEAPHFARLGMEAILYGPGDIAQAHQPDEYVEASRLEPAVDLLGQMIERFCLRA